MDSYARPPTELALAREAQTPQALARLAIVGIFIGFWVVLWVAGIPMPAPFLALLCLEAGFFLVYWRAVRLMPTVRVIRRAHYLMLAAEIVFHTLMVYVLSTVAWLGSFAYVFGLVFTNTFLDLKRGLAYTSAAAASFVTLLTLEATGAIPHYVYLEQGPLRYEDPRFAATTAIAAVGVFFSIAIWISWVGSQLRHERDNALETHAALMDARRELENTNAELEQRVEERTGELAAAFAALRDSEDLLRATVESTADGILVVANAGNVVYANARFSEMWRIPGELLAAGDDEALLDYVTDQIQDRDHFLATVRGIYATSRESFDTIRFNDERVFERYSRPLTRQGQVEGRVWSFRDISERERFESQLVTMATHDPLTGLFNRHGFDEELEAHLAEARRSGSGGGLLYLDLDQFKDVNDSRGHAAGDELLVALALFLRDHLREPDVIARLGGDEFGVLLAKCDEAHALDVADGIVSALRRRTFNIGGFPLGITASVGVAVFPAHGDNSGDLLSRADVAMYQAKQSGRNSARMFSNNSDWQAQSASRIDWQHRIRAALEREEFVLYSQPILDLHQDTVTQYELLLRALDVDGSAVLPGEFLPIAERSGLIRDIDRWVVRRAIGMIAEHARADRHLKVEVNLSGQAFADPTLLQTIRDEIARTRIDPAGLILEVTETAAITNMDDARRFVLALNALGCTFALDDFGVGFSSFAHLKYLPVDYLKIDGSFIRDLPRSPTDQHLVRAIVDVAHALGKKTVAEFVNDAETVALLKAYGVDYAQGFFIGRPAADLPDSSGRIAA